MELYEFIKNFLPDYEKKILSYKSGYFSNSPIKWSVSGIDTFNKLRFDETMQNLIDKICAKQRENCSKILEQNKILNIIHTEDSILLLNAEQPKIDELNQ